MRPVKFVYSSLEAWSSAGSVGARDGSMAMSSMYFTVRPPRWVGVPS